MTRANDTSNPLPVFRTRLVDRTKPGATFSPPRGPYVWVDEKRGDVYVYAISEPGAAVLIGKVRIYKKRRDVETDTRIPGSDDQIDAHIESALRMLAS